MLCRNRTPSVPKSVCHQLLDKGQYLCCYLQVTILQHLQIVTNCQYFIFNGTIAYIMTSQQCSFVRWLSLKKQTLTTILLHNNGTKRMLAHQNGRAFWCDIMIQSELTTHFMIDQVALDVFLLWSLELTGTTFRPEGQTKST